MPEGIKLIRRLARTAFAMLFVAALYLSLAPAEKTPALDLSWDKLNHAFGYFLLIGSLDFGFRTGRDLVAKSVFVLGYSVFIEVVQLFFPYRQFSLFDMAANAFGIACFLLLLPHLKRHPVYRSLLDVS